MAFNPKDHLRKISGNDYLDVKWRVMWFREVQATGRIDTELVNLDPLLVKATVYNSEGLQLATGHGGANAGSKRVVWSGREFEKAETAAIGRALAHAGYGTQFTDNDSDYLADSPVEQTGPRKPTPKPDPLQQDAADLGAAVTGVNGTEFPQGFITALTNKAAEEFGIDAKKAKDGILRHIADDNITPGMNLTMALDFLKEQAAAKKAA